MSDAAAASKPSWYDPIAWPSWVRWSVTAPFSLLGAVVIYFIASIVNGIASGIPPSVTNLMAIGVGVFTYVRIGRLIAPAFSLYVGFTLALTALIFAGWFLGNVATKAPDGLPQWYAILAGLVVVFSSVCGALTDVPDKVPVGKYEIYAWLPQVLRWVLFLPIAIALTTAVCFEFGITLALLHLNSEVVKLVNTPVAVATFIGVSAAVAPKGKNIVGLIFAIFIGLFAVGQLFAGLEREEAIKLITNWRHWSVENVGWAMTPWYQSLTGFGMLAGCFIGAAGATQAQNLSETHTDE